MSLKNFCVATISNKDLLTLNCSLHFHIWVQIQRETKCSNLTKGYIVKERSQNTGIRYGMLQNSKDNIDLVLMTQ